MCQSVESQQSELLPLDVQAELHVRSDRTAVAYRKWLRELGLTFNSLERGTFLSREHCNIFRIYDTVEGVQVR